MTVVGTPIWIQFARRDLRRVYLLVQILQGVFVLATALARTLVEVVAARLLLGAAGRGIALGFLIAGRQDEQSVRSEVAAMQFAQRIGVVLGPLAGAFSAARLGYTVSFVLAALILWGSAGLVPLIGHLPSVTSSRAHAVSPKSWGSVGIVSLIVTSGYVQFYFLGPALPRVLPTLNVNPQATLEVAGWVIFFSGIALALGSLGAPSAANRFGENKAIALGLAGSSIVLALLPAASTATAF